MIVRPAAVADIVHVVPRMRAADAREIYAARFTKEPQALIDDLVAGLPFCIGFLAMADDAGEPIALLAARLMTPTVADVLMLATDSWRVIARPATRYTIERAIPCYLDATVARSECKAWEGNRVARRWLEHVGFREEGLLPAYGAEGETFVQYGRVSPRSATGGRPAA